MEIDLAEIPPLAGFTSKKRDTETGLEEGQRLDNPSQGLRFILDLKGVVE